MMASSLDLAAALRALGYSSAQARRLAENPQREVTRIAARPFRAPARPRPARLPYATRRLETADDGRRIFHGYRADLLVRAGGRWRASRKAAMIEAVRAGTVSLEVLQAEHGITDEEWAAWSANYDQGGLQALKVRALARRRHAEASPTSRISLPCVSIREADHERR